MEEQRGGKPLQSVDYQRGYGVELRAVHANQVEKRGSHASYDKLSHGV